MGIQIAPSILAADFANLERDILAVSDADWLHVDVMDGHFVPNLTLGLPVVERIAQVTRIPIDAHLMIDDPDRWAPRYVEAGAHSVTFHLEAAFAPIRLAREIRKMGARVGVAISPATPVEPLLEHLAEFDMVVVMTVEPGFGSQRLIEKTLPKIRTLRKAIRKAGGEIWVQADGGITADNIGEVVDMGADVLVAGSAVYGADNPGAEVGILRERAREGRRA
ncbi:MAG: ribulose-phosphate 3-epimerase [Demequinaceae bacterium]|nr:ribulose-phosphate 3-epimerase [Demequinaceae bacterium]